MLSIFKNLFSKKTIFVSYRRDGVAYAAGRLTDELQQHFGKDCVFRDHQSIKPGTDFIDAIKSGLDNCASLLVVMGPDWVSFSDENDTPRIKKKNDFVRLEIASALESPSVLVIPVLIAGAKMPTNSELPSDLHKLTRKQAIVLTDQDWNYQVQKLITIIDTETPLKKKKKSFLNLRTNPLFPRRWWLIIIILTILIGFINEYSENSPISIDISGTWNAPFSADNYIFKQQGNEIALTIGKVTLFGYLQGNRILVQSNNGFVIADLQYDKEGDLLSGSFTAMGQTIPMNLGRSNE